MRERKFNIISEQPRIYCKAFEDNSGVLELSLLPKLCLWTKHINVCYHHFCKHVRKGLIKIYPIDTQDQVADVLTKPLPQTSFCHHRAIMCGCWILVKRILRECYNIKKIRFMSTGFFLRILFPVLPQFPGFSSVTSRLHSCHFLIRSISTLSLQENP